MGEPKSIVEILKALEQSNCGGCGEKTCLAFAAAVFRGRRTLDQCPRLSRDAIERLAGPAVEYPSDEQVYLEKLKSQVAGLDFASAAERTGGSFDGDRLTLTILGKNFSVNTRGELSADIHINPWVAIPFLSGILHGKGKEVSGRWVSFRDLKEGRERYPLFQKRCEEPMKRVADIHGTLFQFIVQTLGGRQVEEQFESDISVVLHPQPKVPVMICYWQPDDGMDSSLNVFFDDTADENLDIDSVFMIGAGLAHMFTKIALTHGFD